MATVDEFEVVKEVQVGRMISVKLMIGILCGLFSSILYTLHSHPGSIRTRRRRTSECRNISTLVMMIDAG